MVGENSIFSLKESMLKLVTSIAIHDTQYFDKNSWRKWSQGDSNTLDSEVNW